MKKCLIAINFNAGSSRKISFEKVRTRLGKDFEYTHCSLDKEELPDLNAYDAIAVCGGDGTLGSVLEKAFGLPISIYYFPVGTLNDKAKATRYSHYKNSANHNRNKKSYVGSSNQPIVIGKCQKVLSNGKYTTLDCKEEIFAYVLASGSFTPIGYTSSVKEKQKVGVLAYIGKIIKEYRPYRMHAVIDTYNNRYEDDFTLIMLLKSPRCFGFKFNKGFDANSQSGHLIAIRSPKHDGLLGCIEMFFPFFRTFFMGLKKSRDKGKIIYKEINSLTLTFNDNLSFCKDGELSNIEKSTYKISFIRTLCDFSVINDF